MVKDTLISSQAPSTRMKTQHTSSPRHCSIARRRSSMEGRYSKGRSRYSDTRTHSILSEADALHSTRRIGLGPHLFLLETSRVMDVVGVQGNNMSCTIVWGNSHILIRISTRNPPTAASRLSPPPVCLHRTKARHSAFVMIPLDHLDAAPTSTKVRPVLCPSHERT